MLSDAMVKAVNDQITKELYSSYLYLQMGAWFEGQSLPGFANWMKIQAQEEISHGMIFFNYVCECGGLVELGAIDKPGLGFKSALDVFEKVLEHEKVVTASINNLMDIALSEKHYATQRRLDWFINEQVEEEGNAMDLIGRLKLVSGGQGLFMLDKDLAGRVFVVPSPLAGA